MACLGAMSHQNNFALITVWCVFCHFKILTHTHTHSLFMLGSEERWYPVQCSWCAASRQSCALGGKPGLILVQGKLGLSHSCFSIGINVFVTAWETDINVCLRVCIWTKRLGIIRWGAVCPQGYSQCNITWYFFLLFLSHSFSSLHLQVRPLQAGKFCHCYINSSSNGCGVRKKGKGGRKTRQKLSCIVGKWGIKIKRIWNG